MYSYEDRIRAVKLYIKPEKRTGATIRQLGYPTKNSLKNWHWGYEQSLNLPLGYALSRSKYSDEQKNLAVEHYLNHDRCLAETRKALEYPCRDTLAAWVNELHPERRKSIVGKTAGVQHSPELKQAAVQLNCAPGRPVQGRCKKAGREQADAVQVEKSTTRPRGSCNHETQRRFTARF